MLLDTTTLNQQRNFFDGHADIWLFGYGSLIWKADFDYLERRPAAITGWARRFWQAPTTTAARRTRRGEWRR